MLNSNYVFPHILKVDNKLVFDQNSGYILGNMFNTKPLDCEGGWKFNFEVLYDLLKSSKLVLDIINTDNLRIIGLVKEAFNDTNKVTTLLIYKDSMIHCISEINSYISYTYRNGNKKDKYLVVSLLEHILNMVGHRKDILDLVIDVIGLRMYYTCTDDLVISIRDELLLGSLDFNFVFELKNERYSLKRTYKTKVSIILRVGFTDYYILQDCKDESLVLFKRGSTISKVVLGTYTNIGNNGTLDYETFDNFRVYNEDGKVCLGYAINEDTLTYLCDINI